MMHLCFLFWTFWYYCPIQWQVSKLLVSQSNAHFASYLLIFHLILICIYQYFHISSCCPSKWGLSIFKLFNLFWMRKVSKGKVQTWIPFHKKDFPHNKNLITKTVHIYSKVLTKIIKKNFGLQDCFKYIEKKLLDMLYLKGSKSYQHWMVANEKTAHCTTRHCLELWWP